MSNSDLITDVYDRHAQKFRSFAYVIDNVEENDKNFVLRLLKKIHQELMDFSVILKKDVTIDASNKNFYTLNYIVEDATSLTYSMSKNIKDFGAWQVDEIHTTLYKDEVKDEILFRFIVKVLKYSQLPLTVKSNLSSKKRKMT